MLLEIYTVQHTRVHCQILKTRDYFAGCAKLRTVLANTELIVLIIRINYNYY